MDEDDMLCSASGTEDHDYEVVSVADGQVLLWCRGCGAEQIEEDVE